MRPRLAAEDACGNGSGLRRDLKGDEMEFVVEFVIR
jgi:hypothetical protein